MEFYGLELKTWIILIGIFFLLFIIASQIVANNDYKRPIYIGCFILVVWGLYHFFRLSFYPNLLYYLIAPAGISGFLFGFKDYQKPAEPIKDISFKTNKGNRVIRNVFAGTGIFGGSGSGKTASVIFQYLQHFAKNDFTGVIYDYKDGELTEICKPLFGEKLKVIAVHRPSETLRINPIDPKYLTDEKELIALVNVILDNLTGSEKGSGSFFHETAESLISSIILKFSLYHPKYCTLPHVISFILAVDFSLKLEENKGLKGEAFDTFYGLKTFLIAERRVKIQASAFLLGLASERQTAGVISTLANALRKLAFPQSFWLLTGNELNFGINSDEHPSVVSVLNEPKNENSLNPLIAIIIHTFSKQMMVRNRKPSFILLDEAPTIHLKNMSRIVATMRSFNVASVYCAQDIVQGSRQYTKEGFKEILTNLSTLFFGRANDPDSAKFYEGYFKPINIKTKSRTSKSGNSGGASTTISEKEVAEIRAHEFITFKPGKFAFISGGKAETVQFTTPTFKTESFLKEEDMEIQGKIIANYEKIILDTEFFAKTLGISQQ